MYDIIKKKRDNGELTKEEIEFFINGYSSGEIPDYQVSALLMAIYLNEMSEDETSNLTEAMMNSGDIIDLSNIKGIKVDKHSTGGVGDKTTIALIPLVASCGAVVAKMSGRGLGHTGGTIDKLESIEEFSTSMSKEKFVDSVNSSGMAVCGQSEEVAIADKKIYALRDVTATVDNISLIASSIMSKKLATGADKLILDVKTGDGAFMTEYSDALKLAKEMVKIGENMNRETVAIITGMEEPLGCAVGNSLEVVEAVETLKGRGPKDFERLCITLGAYMLTLSKCAFGFEKGTKKIREAIQSGAALEKFREFVVNQGGNPAFIDDYSLLPQAKYKYEVKSSDDGYVSRIEAEKIGMGAMFLGAGREKKGDELDLSVGIVLSKKVGDEVHTGDVLAVIHYNDEEKLRSAKGIIEAAYSYSEEKVLKPKLIYSIVAKDRVIEIN